MTKAITRLPSAIAYRCELFMALELRENEKHVREKGCVCGLKIDVHQMCVRHELSLAWFE